MEPLFALLAAHPGSVGLPLVAPLVRRRQQLVQNDLLLLDEWDLAVLLDLLALVQEVGAVLHQDVHSCPRDMKDVPGVFVNVTLQIQNFFIPGCLGKAASQSIDISLEGLPGFVGVNLSLAKQKRSDLIKVLKVQALVQIRKGLKSFGGTPGFPNGMNMDANGDLLFHMERQMLEATEDGPCLSSFARDNPFEGSCREWTWYMAITKTYLLRRTSLQV